MASPDTINPEKAGKDAEKTNEDGKRYHLRSRTAFVVAFWIVLVIVVVLPLFKIMSSCESEYAAKIIKISDRFYRSELAYKIKLPSIRELKRGFAELPSQLDTLEGEINDVFDKAEERVDVFLDWYYSLLGDYSRVVFGCLGEAQEYFLNKFAELVLKPSGITELQQKYFNFLKRCGTLLQMREQMKENLRNILAQYEVDPQNISQYHLEASFPDLDTFIDERVLNLAKRISPDFMVKMRVALPGVLGGGGTVVGAALGAKILKKMLAKKGIKVAAKFLFKGVSKVALKEIGGVTGATIGAILGSLVAGPIGTVPSGVLGGALGVVVGLAIEKIMLLIEEMVERDELRKECIDVLREEREKLLSTLRDIKYSIEAQSSQE